MQQMSKNHNKLDIMLRNVDIAIPEISKILDCVQYKNLKSYHA